MRCNIITIFPDIFLAFMNHGMIKRARDKGLLTILIHDLREFSSDSHRSVDDVPYGGGPGMVMKIEPIHKALNSIGLKENLQKRILLSPQGRLLNVESAKELATLDSLVLICGRYEGVDERVKIHLIDEEISIGDYVLSGGEIPAMVLLEVIARFIPGVLGNQESLAEESFNQGLLEYPQYTRPAEYNGWKVPDFLLSGHHENIKQWRYKQSLLKTIKRRPDLVDWSALKPQDLKWLEENGVQIPLNFTKTEKEGVVD